MAVFKKKNKIKKMYQRLKEIEKTNPRMAKNYKGKIAAMEGRKEE